ncbi:DUF4185 domain-containing protein [Actinomycetospora sp. NBRC 106375]|uniref:DUF4185 domain-containing protein n=1 Tax=Actinomycetospora sp. NBRC 106375 TaxID=3032207 RepID=UPI00255690A6|nr:DUF4185 domain-containing protein [Actinomycetospora sp. NBRC 106375]
MAKGRRALMSGAAAVAVGAAVLAGCSGPTVAAPPAPALPPSPGGPWAPVVDAASTRPVVTLMGRGIAADTAQRFGAQGADLGHVFLHRGRLAMLFGDTYGDPPADPFFSVPHPDRRGSTLGWLDSPAAPSPTRRLADMVTDRPDHAKELLYSKHVVGDEETVIPTAGISTGSRMWLHYMSVRQFEEAGHWTTNDSGMAHSDDDGQTWVRDPGAVWSGSSRFAQVAYAQPAGSDTVLVYGIPAGRSGPASLARVPADRLGDRSAYRYRSAQGWSKDERDAVDVVPGPVGELSVGYNSYHGRWLMMYLVDPTHEIVLRSALSPKGPWSPPQVVATTRDFPEAYAPAITPVWNDGPDVVYTLSRYQDYGVDLMRTRLALQPEGLPTCSPPPAAWPAPWWLQRWWPACPRR